MEKYIDQIKTMIVSYGPTLIGAILLLIVGFWAAKKISNILKNSLAKREVDASLIPFLTGLVSALIKVLVVVSAIGMLGIEMTSFVAILGAAGLAIGMAMSGTLSNFAGGVIILILKPFKVGDVIEAQGFVGSVNSIQIFSTILKTPDNKTIFLPNGPLSTGALTNYSTEETRRVDWTFGIGYGDDTATAKQLIESLIAADDRIMKDPEHFVAVSELADSSVNFVVRAWVKSADYWGVYFDMNNNIYNTFNEKGINIPYPQMDVHVHKNA